MTGWCVFPPVTIIAGTKHERQTLDAYAPAGDKLSKAMFEFPDSIPRK